MLFELKPEDYNGSLEGRKYYQSIKDEIELVNIIKVPVEARISMSFICGFNELRQENYKFIFLCDDLDKQKRINEIVKFMSDKIGTLVWEDFWMAPDKKSMVLKPKNRRRYLIEEIK